MSTPLSADFRVGTEDLHRARPFFPGRGALRSRLPLPCGTSPHLTRYPVFTGGGTLTA